MRLIDADALKLRIMEDVPGFLDGGSSITKAFILAMLGTRNATPTIDAVPVVRCEDCCFGEPTINGAGERCIQCTNSNLGMMGECHPLNWFCADGECGKDGEVE